MQKVNTVWGCCRNSSWSHQGSIPLATSAQKVELHALTRACTLAKGKTTNIYTHSRYAFGVAHDFGTLSKQQGLLTSDGNKI